MSPSDGDRSVLVNALIDGIDLWMRLLINWAIRPKEISALIILPSARRFFARNETDNMRRGKTLSSSYTSFHKLAFREFFLGLSSAAKSRLPHRKDRKHTLRVYHRITCWWCASNYFYCISNTLPCVCISILAASSNAISQCAEENW